MNSREKLPFVLYCESNPHCIRLHGEGGTWIKHRPGRCSGEEKTEEKGKIAGKQVGESLY